jgi:hypothetical protein
MGQLGRSVLLLLMLALPAGAAVAADLQPRTAAAFDRYVKAVERQMPKRSTFLWVDRGAEPARRRTRDALAHGELVIDSIDGSDTGIDRGVPDGMVHHWVGAVFVPGGTVNSALTLLQDYDRHASIYAPAVTRSTLLSRNGDTFRMHLRFTMTRVLRM